MTEEFERVTTSPDGYDVNRRAVSPHRTRCVSTYTDALFAYTCPSRLHSQISTSMPVILWHRYVDIWADVM